MTVTVSIRAHPRKHIGSTYQEETQLNVKEKTQMLSKERKQLAAV